MGLPRKTLIAWFIARLARLRFPALFVISALLFVLDLALPDLIPFADEVLLGLTTALFASWRKRRVSSGDPTEKT